MAAKAPTTSKGPKDQKDEAKGPFVLVSTTHGKARRRAGLRFTSEGIRVDVSTLSEAQKTAIQGDPALTVKEVAPQNS